MGKWAGCPPCLLLALLSGGWALSSAATSRSNHIPTPTPITFSNSVNTSIPTTTDYAGGTTTLVESKRPRRRSRRCKCVKRVKKEVSELIEDRLQEFEARYLRPLRHHDDRTLPQKTANGRLQTMDRRLQKVTGEVAHTKEALTLMRTQLNQLRHDLRTTAGDVRALNVSWQQLNWAVQNVSRFVTAVETVLSPSSGCPPEGCQPTVQPTVASFPRHCDEVYQQGGMQFQGDYYIMIKPDGVTQPFKVLCKIFNNSGWTVIQRREDGSVDFFRDWEQYKTGFGSLEGEFWLGNDYIHYLTVQEPTMLRIELRDWEDQDYSAAYDSFRIDDEKGLYRLHLAGYHGNAGDSLRSHWENHDGMPFSHHCCASNAALLHCEKRANTKDRDNDGRYYDSCAEHFHGAWWFNNCFDSHLNGKYYHKGFHQNYFQRDGIQWNSIHMYSSLQAVHMMLKPAPNPQPVLSVPDSSQRGKVKDTQNGGRKKERGKGGRGGSRGQHHKVQQEV